MHLGGRGGLDQKCWEKEFSSPKPTEAYLLFISTKSLGFPKWAWKL